MAKLTPKQAQEKHARRLKAAIEDISIGVDAVTEAPGKKAAAKAEKMLTNLTKAVRDGKWAAKTGAVPLEEWKSKMKTKGIPRISQGVDEAAGKTEAFFAQLLPFQDTLKAKITTMPDLTLEDSIQRMSAWVRGMAGFKPR